MTVSAFEGNEFEKSRRAIVFSGTVIQSMVSLTLLKKIFWEYRTKRTEYRWLRFMRVKVDYQICIMRSKHRNYYDRIFTGLPYPPILFLTDKIDDMPSLIDHSRSILLLLNSQLETHLEKYHEKIQKLVETIHSILPDYHIYLKDHPNYRGKKLSYAGLEYLTVINSSIAAEQIYIKDKDKIGLVIGYGTTSLITASWFGLMAVHISEYLGFSAPVTFRYNEFISFGENIMNMKDLRQLRTIALKNARNVVLSEHEIISQWQDCLKYIVNALGTVSREKS